MERSLNDNFMNDLKHGILINLLERVIKDSTIDLQMRGDSIDIYYRGGVILHLVQNTDTYNATINPKYFGEEPVVQFENKIKTKEDIQDWIKKVPVIKQARDFHYGKNNAAERDFMQLTVRSNSYEKEIKEGNIIITDVEYNYIGKIDLLGLILNKNNQKSLETEFAFIEGKYATSSVSGDSDLIKHLSDIQKFVSNHANEFDSLKKNTKKIFKQKMDLGLYNFEYKHNNKELNIKNDKPKFIILLADYKMNGKNLFNVIDSIKEIDYDSLDIKFAISSLMGYRLYKDCLFTKAQILEHINSISNAKN
ncbi:MAG: hypothetical protein U9N52_08625 [Campylobacterota bacterium]|nr:hypothetical protein [Campylobacterota bacterium]